MRRLIVSRLIITIRTVMTVISVFGIFTVFPILAIMTVFAVSLTVGAGIVQDETKYFYIGKLHLFQQPFQHGMNGVIFSNGNDPAVSWANTRASVTTLHGGVSTII